MAKEIRWTPGAEESFEKVISYLDSNWSEKEINHFIDATERVIEFISEYPLMFRKSAKRQIHEALITEHNLFLNRVKKNHIELLTFMDTRKNPRKKTSRLK